MDPYWVCYSVISNWFLLESVRPNPKSRGQIPYIFLLALCWGGIYLTSSRSALVTLAVAALVAALLLSWRYVLLVVVVVGAMFVLPSRLQQRLTATVTISVQPATIAGTDYCYGRSYYQ